MNTTDEIMALAMQHRHAKTPQELIVAHAALNNSVNELVEQAKWAYHTPKLLSDADAAADLAGVARPGAEPVAWINEEQTIGPNYGKKRLSFEPFYSCNPLHYKHTPLYTAPPQASQPLTDEQIEQCMKQAHLTVQGRNLENAFARAIEQAHGIAAQKGKP